MNTIKEKRLIEIKFEEDYLNYEISGMHSTPGGYVSAAFSFNDLIEKTLYEIESDLVYHYLWRSLNEFNG